MPTLGLQQKNHSSCVHISHSTYVHMCTLFVSYAVFIYYFNCISFAIWLPGRKVAIKLIDCGSRHQLAVQFSRSDATLKQRWEGDRNSHDSHNSHGNPTEWEFLCYINGDRNGGGNGPVGIGGNGIIEFFVWNSPRFASVVIQCCAACVVHPTSSAASKTEFGVAGRTLEKRRI